MTSRRGSGDGYLSKTADKYGRWSGSLRFEGKRRTVYGRTRAEART